MKHCLLLFFTLSCIPAFAQDVDSLFAQQHSLLNVDSLSRSVSTLPDSLLPIYKRADSIITDFNLRADSLQHQYHNAIQRIDSQVFVLHKKVDSLRGLDLPTKKYERSLHKLADLKKQTELRFEDKFNSLKSSTSGKLDKLGLPNQFNDPLQKLSGKLNDLDIQKNVRISSLTMPDHELSNVIDGASVPGINSTGVPQLPDVNSPVLPGISQQLPEYPQNIADVTPTDLADAQNLQETLESQASSIDGLSELQKQSGIVEGHKGQVNEITGQVNGLADPAAAKEKAAELAKKAAVNHFAGREEQLKTAMDKIAKYKQKYSSVASIKDLPKRPPNAMKGRPFIERIVPGLYFQYQQKNYYLLDINPYVGYRLSGRFTTGLGWNHRWAWDNKYKEFNQRARIFGPRGFVDFKIGKGFIAHLEAESMNSFVPSVIIGNADTGQREWVWSCMTGIKKEYKIYKNLKGTALIQYNLFNKLYKAPYVDRLNSRIGFEYQLKKKK